MDKEINRDAVEQPGKSAVENKVLPDDSELQEDELDQINGGSLKLMGEMLNNVSKTRSEISMYFAKNSRA